ncbi:MAG TPA: hypothetical protein VJV78_32360 [Polyangiales bacterium]|nr:hypothetical protein [Polyangiales bacterium]
MAPEWDDVVREFERAAAVHEATQRTLHEVEQYYTAATMQHQQAAQAAERATQEWKLAQALIVLAAQSDAARLDDARWGREVESADISCADGMSTRAYRDQQFAHGISLVDRDVGHIVPRSLGGADHPGNYALLPASVNRSLGNTWNRDVCNWYGAERCARAIAVSRKCGTLHGLGF